MICQVSVSETRYLRQRETVLDRVLDGEEVELDMEQRQAGNTKYGDESRHTVDAVIFRFMYVPTEVPIVLYE